MAEGNDDVACNKDEETAENTEDGNDDEDGSEVEA